MIARKRLAIAALVLALAAGVAIRVVALERVPLGFNQDEACNGYDAFSLLTTGHDHHGNFLPIAIQGFNDYRMPLFDYSLIPLVAMFGLKPWVVRFGAALWGIADLFAVAILAWELIDLRAAAIAVALAALSPWHLFISRFGVETSSASATIAWAMVCFMFSIRRRNGKWLIASAILFGVSLYSYSITKLFAPVIIVWLAFLHRRELKAMGWATAASAAAVMAIAAPQAWMFLTRGSEMKARFYQRSILAQHATIWTFLANWLDHFALGFLFNAHDWLWNESRQLTLLMPAQLILAAAGLAALYAPEWRKKAALIIGWIAAAAMPGALLQPAPNPHPLHDFLLVVPWALLSALGAVFLIDMPLWQTSGARNRIRAASRAIAGTAMVLALAESVSTARFYFTKFPAENASLFQWGVGDVVREAERLAKPGEPIVIPLTINQPYIYVLFFDQYPARRFYSETVHRHSGLFGAVFAFGRYRFGNPWQGYKRMPHGVFVFPTALEHPFEMPTPSNGSVYTFPPPPAPPAKTLRFGREAYAIVTK